MAARGNTFLTPRSRLPVAPRDNIILAPRQLHHHYKKTSSGGTTRQHHPRSQKSSSGGTTRHRHPRFKTTTPSLQEAVLRWHSLLGSAHGPRYWNRTRNLHGHGFQLMRRTFLCCRHQRASSQMPRHSQSKPKTFHVRVQTSLQDKAWARREKLHVV